MLALDGGEIVSQLGEPLDPDRGWRRFGIQGDQSAPCVGGDFVDRPMRL
jgi:hypothetical protein